mgnify:CR=1 FL=1
MIFKPFNRYVLVESVEFDILEESSASILVPDSYAKPRQPYGVYKVLDVAFDCQKVHGILPNSLILVNESMIENIKVGPLNLQVILENHILGLCENKER